MLYSNAFQTKTDKKVSIERFTIIKIISFCLAPTLSTKNVNAKCDFVLNAYAIDNADSHKKIYRANSSVQAREN